MSTLERPASQNPYASSVSAPAPAVSKPRNPLRLWPGIVIIALQWAIATLPGLLGAPMFVGFMMAMWAPLLGLLLLTIWWLFLSKLSWPDRLVPLAVFAAAAIGTALINTKTFPMMGVMFYALPLLTTAWVGWLVISWPLAWSIRRGGLIALFVLGWCATSVLRIDGMDGDFKTTFNWRWSKTSEDLFREEKSKRAAEPAVVPVAAAKPTVELQLGDWPGFRGPQRDARLTGVKLAADFDANPPKLLWRHRVGPGWGSFALVAGRLYTQEQRGESGEEEAVVCYSADTGAELWVHADKTRFQEIVAGPGPRATPTFDSGRIYALGANGTLNCLDAATGAVIWHKDVMKDADAKLPQWGFSASPLVAGGVVTVFAGGPGGKAVLGYKADDGSLAWSAGEGVYGYSSTQLSRLGGVEQLLITTDQGLFALEPTTGKTLWSHSWPTTNVARIIQPAIVDDSTVLVGTGFDFGTRKLEVKHDGDKWNVKEAWTTRDIKPYYNDLVVYKGYIYGFDNSFFTCVNLADGKRTWKQRGYGSGQVLLLADQGALLIISETGELALVEANPEKHKPLSENKFPAISGKTWNHPVVAHGRVYVRNGEEAACYELAPAGDGA